MTNTKVTCENLSILLAANKVKLILTGLMNMMKLGSVTGRADMTKGWTAVNVEVSSYVDYQKCIFHRKMENQNWIFPTKSSYSYGQDKCPQIFH